MYGIMLGTNVGLREIPGVQIMALLGKVDRFLGVCWGF